MKNKNVFMGVLLISIAVFLILNQFGLVTPGISGWNIVLGGFFVGLLIRGIADKSFFGIFFPLAFLWLIFDDVLGFRDISSGTVMLIALLLSIGFSYLFPQKKHKDEKKIDIEWEAYENGDKVGEHQRVVDETTENSVYCSNTFGATTKYINSNNLQRATLDCSFGEIKAYFDNAVVQNPSVEICVHVSFGSVELYIPREWNLVQNANVFAGSVSEKNRNCSDGRPVVELVGEVNFGAVTIIYV
jgi:predicted membrane protein